MRKAASQDVVDESGVPTTDSYLQGIYLIFPDVMIDGDNTSAT
jgi:hypothetical protein